MASSQKANMRKAWLAERIGDGSSDASLVALGASVFKVTEQTIRRDLREVYDRWMDIYEENEPSHKAKFMELGLALLEECRDAGRKNLSFGPAVQQFKTLAVMAGVVRDGLVGKSDNSSAGSSRPDDATVRERITQLQKDPDVKERAMRAGIDIKIPKS